MKTKKLAFLIFMGIVVLILAPIPILRLLHVFQRRGALPAGDSRQFFQALPTPGSDLRFVETNLEIRIPPNASEIHACINSSELDSRVRFILPPPDLPMFIKTTFCERPFVSIDPRELRQDDHDPDWWRPELATDLRECVGGNSYVRQQIMVDRSDGSDLVIYVLTLMGHFEAPAE